MRVEHNYRHFVCIVGGDSLELSKIVFPIDYVAASDVAVAFAVVDVDVAVIVCYTLRSREKSLTICSGRVKQLGLVLR